MSKHPAIRITALVLLFGLIGGILSCGLAYGVIQKWHVRWQTLPQTAEPVGTIRGVTIDTVDVETASGGLLRFSLNRPERGWAVVDAPRSESDANCTHFQNVRPPAGAQEQHMACENYADGGVTTFFVLRQDGRVSYWSAGDHAYEALLLFLCPALAVPITMGMGLAVGLLRSRKKTEQP